MLIRIILTSLLMLSSMPSMATNLSRLGGLYYDSFSGVSGKIGFAYSLGTNVDEKKHVYFSPDESRFVYTDIEYGSKAQKVTVGLGVAGAALAANFRAGLSFAQRDSQNYLGLEGLGAIFFLTLKVGAYHNSDTGNQSLGIGFGFGF